MKIPIFAFVLITISSRQMKICFTESTFVKDRLSPYNVNRDDDYVTEKDTVLEKSYHGLIRENETMVEITPIIKIDEEKICGFHILKKQFHEIPFQIDLINNMGIIRANHPLNCENRKSYHFDIVAIYCDETYSAPANVHITIIDVNEYAPIFLQQSYVTEVEEGRLYKEILRVEATDKDCTPLFGDICKYSILNGDQPFIIDNDGFIKNTEPLSHRVSHNHILSVVAFDCAMKQSSPVMVTIKVRRVCEPKYIGVPERIDYSSNINDGLFIFPKLHLELCDMKSSEKKPNIIVTIVLKTKHISFGCDRDRTNCTSRNDLIDLMPQDAEWTQLIKKDEGLDPIFHFDGKSGAIIPDKILSNHDFSTSSFSIATIFRHTDTAQNKHTKEHIICSADDHKMNRHHMALFVRNCRLIFLLRKNFKEGDLNIFSPAEWRWKIPQVCDNDWHHYVLNVYITGKVELFIDGLRFESGVEDKHSNPEVIDDWPLHAAHGVNTTLSVGSCYQGSENRLKHGFIGDISEVKLMLDKTLRSQDIKCYTNCAEYLKIVPVKQFEQIKTQTNVQMNEIYVEDHRVNNIDNILRNIQYLNIKTVPTVGRRNVEIITKILYANNTLLKVPSVETYIMVNEQVQLMDAVKQNQVYHYDVNDTVINRDLEMSFVKTESPELVNSKLFEKSVITITGETNKLVSYEQIKKGVHILKGLNITVTNAGKQSNALQLLDSCNVVIFPSLNPDHEEINIDTSSDFSYPLNIKTTIDKDGFEVVGNNNIINYLNILQSLVYINKKPAYYLNRVFKLACSQSNTQFDCTELTLTLTVLHPKQSLMQTKSLTDLNSLDHKKDLMVKSSSQYENKIYSHTMLHKSDAPEPKSKLRVIHKESFNSTLLTVFVCVFLTIIIVAVSLAKIKNTAKITESQQRNQKITDEGLVWDDSALTITINPMEMECISDISSESENTESDEEDCVKEKFTNANQLEWDNSNIFATSNK